MSFSAGGSAPPPQDGSDASLRAGYLGPGMPARFEVPDSFSTVLPSHGSDGVAGGPAPAGAPVAPAVPPAPPIQVPPFVGVADPSLAAPHPHHPGTYAYPPAAVDASGEIGSAA